MLVRRLSQKVLTSEWNATARLLTTFAWVDLHQVREFLLHALSPDFARSAVENRDNYVSHKVSNLVNT